MDHTSALQTTELPDFKDEETGSDRAGYPSLQLRLPYITFDPTWETIFIKAGFHATL